MTFNKSIIQNLQLGELDDINNNRSEATFQFAIHNFSKVIRETVYSHKVIIKTLPWQIKVEPFKNDTQCRVSILCCNADSVSKTWSCRASVVLIVLKRAPAEPVTCLGFDGDHLFTHEDHTWTGAREFYLDGFLDPAHGYITDDTFTLEARITVINSQN